MRILVVDDEKKITELVENRLKKEGYIVDTSFDGEDGLYKALSNIYDLIVLDVMLPYKDGFSILKELKDNHIESSIIMLTAKTEIDDKLEGFGKGADDYLTKPFHLEELVARVNARLKNGSNLNLDYLEYEDIKLDLKRKTITCKTTNEEVEVLCKEFLLLECLIQNQKQIISKENLYDKVWGMDNDSISNNMEAYISFIRRKFKSIGSKVNIKAVRGLGYKLEVLDE